MNMSSKHTKSYLEACHENIAVMRHPDHIGSADNTQFWSHHEKVGVLICGHILVVLTEWMSTLGRRCR
jgi:hypothetical protein